MKKILSLLLASAMVFTLASCGSKPQQPSNPGSSSGSGASSTSQSVGSTDGSASIPEERSVTVTDMSGDEVTITGEVNSIINLWPAGTSSFFVMGAGDLITGIGSNAAGAMNAWTEFFYPGAKDIHSMGGTQPTVEDIAAQKPDLVIIHPSTASSGIAQQIRDLGIPALNTNFSTYEQMTQAYTMLGEVLGGEYQEKLTTWCSDVQSTIAAHRELCSSLPEEDKPVVYYIAGQADDLLTTMAAGSIMQDWVESNGGIYATTLLNFDGSSTKGSNVTAEEVFKLDPDIIIVGGVYQHTLMDQLQKTDGWKELKAVKNGRVYNNPYGCFNWDRFGLESLLQLDYALLRIQPELAAGQGITEESMIQKIIDFYAYYNGKQMSAEEAANMFNGLQPDGTMEVPVQ